MSQESVRVIVEVNGGSVSNVVAGDFVDVQVLDWDNLLGDGSTPDDTRRTWDEMPEHVQEYVKENYPEDFDKIQDAIKLANG